MRHDLLLTGGHVIDPASGVDGRRDVAFASGRVAAVDAAIPRESAREVVDVSGAYVAPGLVDLHAHAFIAGHDLGIETDPVCASTGVTTLCDAGSTGAAELRGAPRVRDGASRDARPRVRPHRGHRADATSRSESTATSTTRIRISPPAVAREHRDVVVGVKVRIQKEVVAQHGLEPLRRGLRAAEAAGVPVIVHVNNPPVEYGEVLALLRPGRHRQPLSPRPGLGDPRRAGAGQGRRAGRAPPRHRVRRGPRAESRELPRRPSGVRAGLLPRHDLLGPHAPGPGRRRARPPDDALEVPLPRHAPRPTWCARRRPPGAGHRPGRGPRNPRGRARRATPPCSRSKSGRFPVPGCRRQRLEGRSAGRPGSPCGRAASGGDAGPRAEAARPARLSRG